MYSLFMKSFKGNDVCNARASFKYLVANWQPKSLDLSSFQERRLFYS